MERITPHIVESYNIHTQLKELDDESHMKHENPGLEYNQSEYPKVHEVAFLRPTATMIFVFEIWFECQE